MEIEEILSKISNKYNKILKKNLIGIYIHGSLAFECFSWKKSDIDFLVVTKTKPCLKQKMQMIQVLLELGPEAPPKGFEMSVVLERYCQNFIYPTPFELHFSNSHLESCRRNLEQYCLEMNGTDRDLAAHFTVTKKAGYPIYGKKIDEVFGDVPKKDYLDSIRYDVEEAVNEIFENPVYYILNLCRVLAYEKEGLVLSKAQGGAWGLKNFPSAYASVIDAARKSYVEDKEFQADKILIKQFAEYMSKRKLDL